MPLIDKTKAGKKNRNPFCKTGKRKTTKKAGKEFSEEKKKSLAHSDKGSYFDQEKQWPELCASTSKEAECSSRSKQKLDNSMASFQKRKALELEMGSESGSDSEYSDFCSSDSEEDDLEIKDQLGIFYCPVGNSIVNAECIQEMVDNSAVCKDCHSPLQILEQAGSRQGLGAKWIFSCSDETCISHETRVSAPISERTGQKYKINTSSVVAFRAIGKGRAAAEKCLSMLDLSSPVYTWSNHTKDLESKAKDLTETSMKDAGLELKKFKRSSGAVPVFSEDELEENIIDVATSFDCSWNSRGWSARDGVVAAISEDTGKVLDVVFLTNY